MKHFFVTWMAYKAEAQCYGHNTQTAKSFSPTEAQKHIKKLFPDRDVIIMHWGEISKEACDEWDEHAKRDPGMGALGVVRD